jgi:hypothetical protein
MSVAEGRDGFMLGGLFSILYISFRGMVILGGC